MRSAVAEVASWPAAQRQVPFPLHRPLTPPTRITVRPWTRALWPTVISEHEFHGARLRLKQFVDGWVPGNAEVLLSYFVGTGGGGGVHVYGPPLEPFFLGRMPCCHAGHYYGVEGGAAIAHMVSVDVVVREGHLGTAGLQRFLRGLAWADARPSPARYRRPLFEWSWSLREQRDMWSWPRAKPWSRHFRWSKSAAGGVDGPLQSEPPHIPGFLLDCVGSGPREVRLYYRPLTGHQPLVVAYSEGRAPRLCQEGPLDEQKEVDLDGARGRLLRVPSIGGAVVTLELPGASMVVTVPPSSLRDPPSRPLRLARAFLGALSRK